jgi:signal transduction histidine kinase
LEDNESFEGLEVTHTFDETQRTLLFNARRLEQSQKILLAMEDITQRKVAMEEVQELNEKLKARVRRTRKLASDLSIAEHRERERVSHILHDDLQQLLYAIEGKMQLILNEMDDPEDSGIGAQLEELQTWTKNAVQTTRQLTVDLSPPILREENLADAIEWLKSQMKELHDFEVIIEAEDTEPLGDDIRLLLFQIVRELLFNAHKHAGVDVAVVRLESPRDDAPDAASDAPIAIHVIDQGKGFDPDEMETSADGGFGLSRAQERLDLLGGHLSIESAPGRGTQATIYAPPLRGDDAPSDR